LANRVLHPRRFAKIAGEDGPFRMSVDRAAHADGVFESTNAGFGAALVNEWQ
jgi:hypothetical protein